MKRTERLRNTIILLLLTNPKMERCYTRSSASSSFRSGPDSTATTGVKLGCRQVTSELFEVGRE